MLVTPLFFLECVYLSRLCNLLLIFDTLCVCMCVYWSGFGFHLQLFFLCVCVNVYFEIVFPMCVFVCVWFD